MANLSKDLKKLFHASLNKPRVEYGTYQPKLFNGEFSGIIYFYEWSDINRTPKSFYSIEKFEEFINRCSIYMQGYQREIIRNMRNPYITCKRGKRELVIKSNYQALKSAMESSTEEVKPPLIDFTKKEEDKEPYNVAITRPRIQKPKMVFEVDSRYPDIPQMGMENGEYWDWG